MQPEVAPLSSALLEGGAIVASLSLAYFAWNIKQKNIRIIETQVEET